MLFVRKENRNNNELINDRILIFGWTIPLIKGSIGDLVKKSCYAGWKSLHISTC